MRILKSSLIVFIFVSFINPNNGHTKFIEKAAIKKLKTESKSFKKADMKKKKKAISALRKGLSKKIKAQLIRETPQSK